MRYENQKYKIDICALYNNFYFSVIELKFKKKTPSRIISKLSKLFGVQNKLLAIISVWLIFNVIIYETINNKVVNKTVIDNFYLRNISTINTIHDLCVCPSFDRSRSIAFFQNNKYIMYLLYIYQYMIQYSTIRY